MYIKYLTYIYVDMIYVCVDTIYNTYIGEHPPHNGRYEHTYEYG